MLPFVSEKMLTFALETFGDESHSPQVNLGNSFGKANRRKSSTEKLSVDYCLFYCQGIPRAYQLR